jgi:uncharacterized protein (DUF1015 family)
MSESYTKPFRGILYNKQKAGDVSLCVCPPYDVIPSDAPYLERSPYNAIRLELPADLPDTDRYTSALHTFEKWYKEGILKRDDQDTIYIYEQEFEIEDLSYLRRGFIALNKLDKGRILTHEQTRKKAKEDREKLITTLKTLTSFVFGLYEDKTLEIEEVLSGAKREIVYDFTDEQSIRNRFYRMTDGADIKRLTASMDKRNIYVADGHHRLDVSYRLGVSHVPLYLTNMYSDGIVILPYHRMIKSETARSLSDLLSLLGDRVQIEKHAFNGGAHSTKEVLKAIATAAKPSFALYSKDDVNNFYVLTVTAPLPGFSGNSPLEKLKVNILHTGIVKELLHFKEEEISFTQDQTELVNGIRDGLIDLAFLLPPTTTTEVKEVADNSLDMPPKSTFFYPKILTGLLFHKYA